MKLFERFDKVFCINLEHRVDRLENFISQVEKYDLGPFSVKKAINGKHINNLTKLDNGNLGLVLTNKEIILESIENKYNSILVIEDDCYFTDEILNIDTYFHFLPDDWDMLYMGGNHNTHCGEIYPKKINDKVIKLHNTYTTHFVGIKNSVYNTILNTIDKYEHPLDVMYSKIQKEHNVYSFYPAIAKQLNGYSDIQNNSMNYDWLIK